MAAAPAPGQELRSKGLGPTNSKSSRVQMSWARSKSFCVPSLAASRAAKDSRLQVAVARATHLTHTDTESHYKHLQASSSVASPPPAPSPENICSTWRAECSAQRPSTPSTNKIWGSGFIGADAPDQHSIETLIDAKDRGLCSSLL